LKLKNRVALVTGGARGIGFAIAERFVAEGATIIIADVLDAEGKASAKKLGATYMTCDVSKSADTNRVIATTIAQFGAIDILVNNAAISVVKDFLDVTEDDFDKVLGINLKGSFLLAQAAAKQMVKQVKAGRSPGCIINMSSVNDTLAIETIAPYTMSKGGVKQLTSVAAIALAPHGIRVNGIGPGSIMTDMLKGVMVDGASRRRILSRTPMGRVGLPEEMAAIAAFLASDDASYITGQIIYADGGRMHMNYTVPVKD
jgi:NAD(P)-dependent dehydrogenase (short-subunit alcohol dehydrogenase family)